MEGTYPLPEAQVDRFLVKLRVPFPGQDALVEIARRTTGFAEPDLDVVMTGPELIEIQQLVTQVPIAEPIVRYAAGLILATHPDGEGSVPEVGRYISYGASPRGLQALVRGGRAYCLLDGRTAVSTGDIQRFARQALRHRLILNFEGEAESVNVDDLIARVLEAVPTPAGDEA
jgi:MoxR-like ATPase